MAILEPREKKGNMAIAGLFILAGLIGLCITAFRVNQTLGGFVLAGVLILIGFAFTK